MITIRLFQYAAIASCLSLTACAGVDSPFPSSESDQDISMSILINAPKSALASSRAADPGQDFDAVVNSLHILLFAAPDASTNTACGFVDCLKSTRADADEDAGIYSYYAKIPVSDDTPDYMTAIGIANAESVITDSKIADWKQRKASYPAIAAELQASVASMPVMSLWGRATRPVDKSLSLQAVRMPMLRDRAYYYVTLNSDVTNFKLLNSGIWNHTDSYLLMPETANLNLDNPESPLAVKPSLGTDATRINDNTFTSTEPVAFTGGYLAEQDILMDAPEPGENDANRTNRAAIIVGGLFGSMQKPCYYRVDFKDGDGKLVDVLRNHRYVVRVAKVNGPGADTPEEAYNTITASISATVEPWTDVESIAAFDGSNWIAMPERVEFGPQAGTTRSVEFSSNVAVDQWAMAWGEATDSFPEDLVSADPTGADTPVYDAATPGTSRFMAVINPTTGILDITTLADYPSDTTEPIIKRLFIRVTPRLRVIVNVAQSDKSETNQHLPWEDWNINFEFE